LLGSFLQDINWVGFYLYENGQLWLGPFQGLPACTQIPMGKGVCGSAAQQRKTIVVPNVHEFPGHIACDAASKSEIVIPIVVNGELYGVLDIDSPIESRFDDVDREYLEKFVYALASFL
jgi:L-methionine (R)-S-oxide reductase